MIIGIGSDIVCIQRIEKVLQHYEQRFVERILTPYEQRCYRVSHQPIAYMAKRYAAKEATAKALQVGIGRYLSFQDIEISHNASGAPLLILLKSGYKLQLKLGISDCHLSLSDEKKYALAFVILNG